VHQRRAECRRASHQAADEAERCRAAPTADKNTEMRAPSRAQASFYHPADLREWHKALRVAQDIGVDSGPSCQDIPGIMTEFAQNLRKLGEDPNSMHRNPRTHFSAPCDRNKPSTKIKNKLSQKSAARIDEA